MTPEALQRLEAALARPRVHPLLEPEETFLVTVERGDLRALLEERRWISVQEKLPEEHQRVLVMYRGAVWTARWNKPLWLLLPTNAAHRDEITHWMPLPAPPTTPSPEETK